MRLLNALSLFCICIADCHDERSIYNSWELFGINSQAKCLPTNFGNIDSKSASSGTSTNEFRSQASNAGIEKIIEGGDGEIANDTLQNLKTSDENLVKEINESDYGNVPREATGGVDALTSDSRSGNEENDTNMDPPPAAVEVELPGVEEIPPGSSSYNRESILINLSKKIAAIEFNLTLSTEYLSEFSKHYVNQMNEYKVEAAESRRNNAHEIAKQVNLVIRTQMTHVRQEIEDLKRKFTMLQTERNKHQYGLSKTYVNYQHRCVNGPLSESTARVSRMLQLTNVFDNQKRLPATFAIPSSWNAEKMVGSIVLMNFVGLGLLVTYFVANAWRLDRALTQQEQRLLEEIRSQVDAKERRPRRHAVNGVRREKEIIPGELIKEQSSSAKQLTSVIAAAIAPQVAQIKELLAAQDDVDDDAAINLLANDVSDASDNENADTESLSS